MTYSQVELTGSSKDVDFAAVVQYGGDNPSDLDQIPGDSRIWIDLNERARTWVLRDAFFTSESDYKKAMEILEDDNTITFRARRANGSYNYYDGVNSSWVVGYRSHSEAEQMDYAGHKWKVPRISLVQAE